MGSEIMTIEVVEFFYNLQNGFFDFFFNLVSFLGEEYIYILIIGTVYYTYDKKLGEFLAFTLFFTGLFNNYLKQIISAPRPFQKYSHIENRRPGTSTGSSFPSGHTQMFTAFWFAGSFHFKKVRLIVVASVLSSLMAMSRMYLGVHFLEDVVVSIILGILTAYILSRAFFKLTDNQLKRLYGIIILFFTGFVFYFGGEDFFKAYGMMVGFYLAMNFEKSKVHFTLDVSKGKKVLRVALGLIVMVVIQIGLGFVFDMFADEGSYLLGILDMIRYGLISFVGLGVYPLLFKKYNF